MSDLLFFIVVFILIVYLSLIVILIRGWVKIPFVDIESDVNQYQTHGFKTSVIICCRNEAHHLPALINALKNQSNSHFELIWVNDHSTDQTQLVLEDSLTYFADAKIFQSPQPGKKQAQRAGILAANGELIITTDADCVPASTWIETMVDFQSRQQADLIIAPVKFYRGKSLFTQIQQLEFATLVGSGMGAAGAGMPVFCNAANMAFTKQAWIDSANDLHEEELSGDDVFLLHSIKKRKGKVAVLKSMQAMVITGYQKTLKSFFRQRVRWASKSPKYKDVDTIVTGLIVAAINLLLPVLAVFAVFQSQLWLIFGVVFLLKLMIDVLFLMTIRPFFQLKINTLHVLLLSLLYPVYVVGVGMFSIMRDRHKW
ncbi:MAG: glycosyltransferase [Paludibacter sp.]|nr:glycosyltransferase [Paludibacter sp.]